MASKRSRSRSVYGREVERESEMLALQSQVKDLQEKLKMNKIEVREEVMREVMEGQEKLTPRCSSGANAGGRPFCHELDIGWVHIVHWIFSILAISDWLFWRKSVFCVFTL